MKTVSARRLSMMLFFLAGACLAGGCASGPIVTVLPGKDRVEVRAEGRPFAIFRWGENAAKPVIYPLWSPSGIEVLRAYPFETREGESHDHPHHQGIFFTYDKVNGEGFWHAVEPPPRIRLEEVVRAEGGRGRGVIQTRHAWVGRSGRTLLEEERTMVFRPDVDRNVIDFDMTLRALEDRVEFEDTKEGMFGIRVAPWLKEKGGTGRYLNDHGDESEAGVWGKRANWVRLEGHTGGRTVGIAVFDHPENVNHPTYWHARGYGLFAVNPLGQGMFQKLRGVKNPVPFHLVLKPGETARFRWRVVVYEGPRSPELIQAWYDRYAR